MKSPKALFYILVLFATVVGNRSFAQDCSCVDCPIFVPQIGSALSCIDISSLTNGTLNVGGQGICAISLDFTHTWIGDVNISLIAPNGSSVDLVWDGSPGGATGEFWDVTFVPCGDAAFPDPGMPDVFPSSGWPNDGPFTGSYYPGNGCFEDLTGSANGSWCIEIIDNVGGDVTNLLDWSITFCDDDGVDCSSSECNAEGGEINFSDLIYCEGEPLLLPTITGQNTDIEYGYTFYVIETGLPVGTATPILILDAFPDITSLPVGFYSVCGLSYLLTDGPLLPTPNGVYDNDDMMNDIAIGTFCADNASSCPVIQIINEPDAPILDFPTEICIGDETSIVNLNYDPLNIYQVIINSGSFSSMIQDPEEVIFTANTNDPIEICIQILSDCGDLITCANITVIGTIPEPQITGELMTCYGGNYVYTVSNLAGITDYIWSIDSNEDSEIIGSNTGSTVLVSIPVNNQFSASICIDYTTDCGESDQYCIDITPSEDFSNPVNITPVSYCGLSGLIEITADYPAEGIWSTISGPGNATFSNILGFSTNVTVTSPGVYVFQYFEPDCGGSIEVEVTFLGNPDEIIINGLTIGCTGDLLTLTAFDASTVSNIEWSITSGDAIIIGSNSNEIVDVQLGTSVSSTLCINGNDLCGDAFTTCIDLTLTENQLINNTLSQFCDLDFLLDITVDGIAVSGTWTLVTGSGTGSFVDAFTSQTNVSVTTIGNYVFNFMTDACGTSIDVDVEILSPVMTVNTVVTCIGEQYTVSFDIIGGVAPYQIDGIAFSNTNYTSDLLSGENYNIVLSDVSICDDWIVSGMSDCVCESDAGTMDPNLIEVCGDVSFTTVSFGDEFLDGDDNIVYIMHTSSDNSLGIIWDENTSGIFSYLPGMLYGVTYYISAVVGNASGTSVDLTDPCLSVSFGSPVIFYQEPVINMITANPISSCDPNFTLTVSQNTTVDGIWTTIGNPIGGIVFLSNLFGDITVATVTVPGTYIMQYQIDNGSCTVTDQVEFTYLESPLVFNIATICDPTNTTYTVSFEILGGSQPYVVDGNNIAGNSFTSTPINSGSTYAFTVEDAMGCESDLISGSKNCACITDAGSMDPTPLEICGTEVLNVVGNGDAVLDNNDNILYVLHTSSTNIIGIILAQDENGNFTFLPPMEYGVTYYISTIVGDALGASIDFNDPCLNIALGQPITFYEEIDIDMISVSQNDSCVPFFELEVNTSTDIAGIWSIVSSPPSSQAMLSVINAFETDIEADIPGVYIIQYDIVIGACSASEQIIFTYFENPEIINIAYICDDQNENYQVSFDIIGGTPGYIVNGLTATNGSYISEPIASGSSQMFTVFDTEASCISVTLSYDCELLCTSDAGNMLLDLLEICESDTIDVINDGGDQLDSNDIGTYILHTSSTDTLGVVIEESSIGIFAISGAIILGETYYISYVVGDSINGDIDLNDPCLSVAIGQPVIFIALPTLDLGPDIETCETNVILTTVFSTGDSFPVWNILESVSGSNASLSVAQDTTTIFSTDLPGTYIISAEVNSGLCVRADSISITISEPASAAILEYICDVDNNTYQAQINLSGTGPFIVDNEQVFDNLFTTSDFPSGSAQTILINNICGEISLDLEHDCDCPSDPGIMPIETLMSCAEFSIEALTADSIIAAGYNLIYVLHTSSTNSIGDVIAFSGSGIFSFDVNSMIYGQTYYISAVVYVGVNVDFDADCTILAAGTPVIWNALSTVIVSVEDVICEGDSLSLSVTYNDGSLPITLYLVDDLGNNFIIEVNELGNTSASILPFATDYLQIDSIIDGNGCNVLFPTVSFEYIVLSEPTIGPETSICNTTIGGSTIILSSLLSSNEISGTWSSDVGFISGDIIDFNGVPQGLYEVRFTADPGPCGDLILVTNITVLDCACPENVLTEGTELCQGIYALDLEDYVNESFKGLGVWSLIADPMLNPLVLNGTILGISEQNIGVYSLQYFLNEVPQGCENTYDLEIIIYDSPSAGAFVIDVIEFCIGDLTQLILFEYLEDNDQGGQWTTTDNLGIEILTGIIDLNDADGGIYRYEYMMPANGICPASSASVLVQINNPLELYLSLLDPICFGDTDGTVSVEDSEGNAIIDFLVIDEAGVEMNPDSLSGGNYTLTAVDVNGCIAIKNFTLIDPLEKFLDLGDNIELKEGEFATITPVLNVGVEDISLYQWFINQAQFDSPTFDTLILAPQGESLIQLIITDEDGCIVADDLLITILENQIELVLPNVFNPLKEEFMVPAYEVIQVVEQLSVFDRWGNKVFSAENYDPKIQSVAWNGNFNGRPVTSGVYVYSLQYIDIKGKHVQLYGDVTVL